MSAARKTRESIAVACPELVAEWHPTKNGARDGAGRPPTDLMRGSGGNARTVTSGWPPLRAVPARARDARTARAVSRFVHQRSREQPSCAGGPVASQQEWRPHPWQVKAGTDRRVWWADHGQSGRPASPIGRTRATVSVLLGPQAACGVQRSGDDPPDVGGPVGYHRELRTDPAAGERRFRQQGLVDRPRPHVGGDGCSRASEGVGCPYCAGTAVLPGFNDLATTHPDLSSEWHPTANGDD